MKLCTNSIRAGLTDLFNLQRISMVEPSSKALSAPSNTVPLFNLPLFQGLEFLE